MFSRKMRQNGEIYEKIHIRAARPLPARRHRRFLRFGANPDLRDAHGNTALFRAVFASRGEGGVIQLLRKAGADPTARNASGVSPLSLARTIANNPVAVHFADLGPVEGDA